MDKRYSLPILLILCLSLVSASGSYYNLDSGNDYTYYHKFQKDSRYYQFSEELTLNEDRYSTYDYRHGYTYRDTDEFKRDYYKWLRDRDRGRRSYDKRSTNYYYEYDPFKHEYKKIVCYDEPPEGKWIYRRCPNDLIHH